MEFRFAPLPARRDMALLELLPRVWRGRAPAALQALFPAGVSHSQGNYGRITRAAALKHCFHLADFVCLGGHTEVMRRSCFSLVANWNMLPVSVAETKDAKFCQ